MNMHIVDLSVTFSESSGVFFGRTGAPGVSLIGKLSKLLPPVEIEELDKISLTLVYTATGSRFSALSASLFLTSLTKSYIYI